ncbi:ammonium transporter [Nocardia brasiliensis NBRC 14402]|uniref:Ammonium transporter n=1 Tax=Nocardia brasiliensis (strain ATCC 700358 / HUJEG-1) TaxID=1133849 RepID=K0F9X7_NOCB7|nr:ammonium transporter [Nocardia brasiliensis]AFU04206.1 ammonium transporter [Nocardia brasiliensis ATCC 700358]OCF91360.1 ammonia channel protein [Nocardia brasiliensis]GAJ79867.1 ammonium transporter [Nocardia brasiliensis NBRC 14402]SUB53598.1 Ammonia transporter [Nocardia brasiliensis]
MAFPLTGAPDTGDTAWMLASSALVLLMTPGLAFFYGGMVRSKNVLNMIMMSVSAMGLVGVLWSLYGFSTAFGDNTFGLIGDPAQFFGLKGLLGGNAVAEVKDATGAVTTAASGIPLAGTIPMSVFVAFQLMFAIITVALISGAVADRMKFGAWLLFAGIWVTVVYFPVAHWVFDFDAKDADGNVVHEGGWIANKLLAVDFAGGTAVHINAGAAALALVLVLGKRKGWPTTAFRPHNLPFVMLGAGLLWFGWFGFNAGSALTSGGLAGTTFVTTAVATAAAMLAWLLVEKLRDGHATSLGAASGIVAGLVAITPSCSSVNVLGALAVGVVAGALCALAVGLKFKFGFDDSLDVVGVHLVGGIVGTLMVGFVAAPEMGAAKTGLFYGGGIDQLWRQAVGAGVVLAFSFVASLIIAYIVKFTIGLRASEEAESVGLDESEHAESAYDFAAVGSTARSAVKEA